MKTEFIVNDYIIIWNLLFRESISEKAHNIKKKLWNTYRKEYNDIYKDRELIMKDYKNFIPSDDTIYNIVINDNEYMLLEKETKKNRLEIMKIWDKNKKITEGLVNNIIRKKIDEYNMYILPVEFDVIEYQEGNSIIIGKDVNGKNDINILLDINMELFNNTLKCSDNADEIIKKVILELAIYNEYATRLTGVSCYNMGSASLINERRLLYPYWLMYLGIPKNKFSEYMDRDKIYFDIDKYAYEEEFKKMNIEEFINFCSRNKKIMLKNKNREIENNIEII